MHVTCQQCGLVYDLTSYAPGQKLRCRCGAIIVRPKDLGRPRILQAFHCSACGGNIEQGRPDCPYCGALVDLSKTRLTTYCPSCLAMLPEEARFCTGCGKPMARAGGEAQLTDSQCPRCRVALRSRSVGRFPLEECPMCLGLFVPGDQFDALVRDQEGRVQTADMGNSAVRATLSGEPVVYLNCPRCSVCMNRINFGRVSGVIIDNCRKHGYWLDGGELEKIAAFVASGGMAKAYEQQVAALKAERDELELRNHMPGVSYGSEAGYGEMGPADRRQHFSLFDAIEDFIAMGRLFKP